ncbi:hypothetical protein DUNSADRAFT_1408 [Dunaliella salina]|uniref:Encoded protein n=1 Tax=Dunaliella salina TaxID=3046 RepID=A0ABQ7GX50_DUNSA|nr:hypothetical protein DUNSADRAFT_1408 [Dunaliella salina]|eukprot:KAF5839181.1 hypothetical protein DUNSADRAFT_1408 [Dunaliella salina]
MPCIQHPVTPPNNAPQLPTNTTSPLRRILGLPHRSASEARVFRSAKPGNLRILFHSTHSLELRGTLLLCLLVCAAACSYL